MTLRLVTDDIVRMTGGKLGTFDVPCPECGPHRRAPVNQRRPVLRIWSATPGFSSYSCARCGEHGFARDGAAGPADPVAVARAQRESAERQRAAACDRLHRAQWLWGLSRPIGRTIAETYLREARGYRGPLARTLRFLPARGEHGPAVIAAFALAMESAPGEIAAVTDNLRGVHLTRLLPDGSGKAADPAKIMIGFSIGAPIVLAPPNDLLGLTIAEGIEDALSAHEATGLGAWAAGAASRLPALAEAVPSHVDCVSVLADDDVDGKRHARALAERLRAIGFETRLSIPASGREIAA